MKVPIDRVYSETHERFLIDDGIITMGINKYAADELSDITYVDLPEVGASVHSGAVIGEVESVKATSEVLSAVAGEVVEINAALSDHPELINDDAFEEGWLVRIRPTSTGPLESLLDAKKYESFVQSAG